MVNFLFFSYSYEMRVCFLILHCIILQVIAIAFCLANLFSDCANDIVNIFSIHNGFNATNNFYQIFKFYMQFS